MNPTLKTDFPQFFQAYLTAALWSSTIRMDGDSDKALGMDGDPFDTHFSTNDFTEEAREVLRSHAFSFWCRMWYYINHEKPPARCTRDMDAGSAGHDFWLTQNGHGAGFWDGDWPVYGEMFTKLSKCYPELNLYVTENGRVGVE